MAKKLIFWILFIPQGLVAQKVNLTIRAENLKVAEGKMFVAVFDVKEQSIRQEIVDFNNRKFEYVIKNLEKGKYAIKIFADINQNKRLDTNLIGYPKEPFGLSNLSGTILAPPKFKQMLFDLTSNQTMTIYLHE